MDVPITCPCPRRADGETRHPDGDTVVLRDRLDFDAATTVRKAIGLVAEEGGEPEEILSVMTKWYALLGIEAWTLVDEQGKQVPVNRATIRARLLENDEAYDAAMEVTDAADALYMAKVILPLVVRASRSSLPTPTEPSTSAPRALHPKRPKPSRPSSTASTPTDGIEATSSSLAGVSSSSQSSGSAA